MRIVAPILALSVALMATGSFKGIAAERAGDVTKMQPDAFQALDAPAREMRTGDEVFRNATLYTRQYGTVEVLLDDGTDLMLSPNASVKIDDYVYAGNSGSMVLSLASGAIRVISGRLPKESYTVTSTIAHIGVRGTRFWLDRGTPDLLKIWVDEGAVVARPVQSTEVFEFTAPIYAECTVITCEITPAPPPPVKYPTDPRGFRRE